MSNTEIQSKVNELRELRRMADELAAEIEAARNRQQIGGLLSGKSVRNTTPNMIYAE